MKQSHILRLIVAALFAPSTISHADTISDPAKGEETAKLCVACHQADGSGMDHPSGESWPRLAGLNAQYLYKQLLDVKSGSRQAPTMQPFVTMLNDEQMADVSAYYASLSVPAITGRSSDDEALLALGEKLATRGDWPRYIPPCSACHGPDNLGVGSAFPALAGQHAGYIEQQLRNWQEDKRQNDPDDLMVSIAKRLTDEDITAVSIWLSQQPAVRAQGGEQ